MCGGGNEDDSLFPCSSLVWSGWDKNEVARRGSGWPGTVVSPGISRGHLQWSGML